MRPNTLVLAFWIPSILACTAEDDALTDRARGPIGKADLYGSCAVEDCGGPSADGNCWCDDLCTYYGDCCEDKVAVCDCPEVSCSLECENGLATDENGCTICECKPQFCGGFAGVPCPDWYLCVDDPSDDCDPLNGGADCGGICVQPEQCGGFANWPCPEGKMCVDNPWDDCDPMNGGADCGGICIDEPPCPSSYEGFCAIYCAGGSPVPPPPHCPPPQCECDEPATDSCSGHCGGKSEDGSCWCDDLCTYYGDCCADKAEFCD